MARANFQISPAAEEEKRWPGLIFKFLSLVKRRMGGRAKYFQISPAADEEKRWPGLIFKFLPLLMRRIGGQG